MAKAWRLTIGACLAVALAPAAFADEPDPQAGPDANADRDALVVVELSTIGVDMQLGAPVVLLRHGESERVIPIWVGLAEAQAIHLGLHGIAMPRPMTHDLLASVIRQLDATVHEVVVDELREGTYHGRLRLEMQNGEIRDIDSRPSDAMALALRTDAPIRVNRAILDEAPPFDFVIPDEMDPVVRTLGVTVVELTDARRAEHNVPDDQPGVLVTSAAGDAREQGLRRGDVIESVNGQRITEPMAFFDAIQAAAGQGAVQLTTWREGETFEIELDIAVPMPPPQERRGPRMEV